MKIDSLLKILFEKAQSTSILILNTEGIILDMNFGFQKTFGYSKKDLIGKNFVLLFTEEDKVKEYPENELKRVRSTGYATDNNYIVHKNGTHIWVQGENIFTKDSKGETFLIKIIQDANAEKKLARELEERNKELEKVLSDRNNFVYAASHDLQAPINNIEGLAIHLQNIFSEDFAADEGIRHAFDMLFNSIEKFRNKIRELADIGKVQENVKIATTDVTLKELLKEIVTDLNIEIQTSGSEIIDDFSALPVIRFSLKNLRSVLHNLISNAIKFRSPDRKSIIHVKTEKIEGKYALLQVQDNGMGIKTEDQAKIFEMYTRLDDHVQGTGVGMSLIKRIMENVGGKIEIDSSLNEGTTFKVYFPL